MVNIAIIIAAIGGISGLLGIGGVVADMLTAVIERGNRYDC